MANLEKAINLKDLMTAFSNYRKCQDEAINYPQGKNSKENYQKATEEYQKACEPINKMIWAAEGRAKARRVNVDEIVHELERIEDYLDITKKAMNGVVAELNPNAQQFPRAYKYTPESTHVRCEFKNGSWRIVDVYRAECGKRVYSVTLTDEAEKAILDRCRKVGQK